MNTPTDDGAEPTTSTGQLLRAMLTYGVGAVAAFAVAVLLASLLTGCASRAEVMPDPSAWVHPTKADTAFTREAHVCHQEAVEFASGGGVTIPFANLVRERQAECLEARFGWQPADSSSGS